MCVGVFVLGSYMVLVYKWPGLYTSRLREAAELLGCQHFEACSHVRRKHKPGRTHECDKHEHKDISISIAIYISSLLQFSW